MLIQLFFHTCASAVDNCVHLVFHVYYNAQEMSTTCTKTKKGRNLSDLFEFCTQPSVHLAWKSGPMPQATIAFIAETGDRVVGFVPVKTGDHSDQLFLAYMMFVGKLVITAAGVPIPYLHDPVEHILAVPSSVKGQIVFFKLALYG